MNLPAQFRVGVVLIACIAKVGANPAPAIAEPVYYQVEELDRPPKAIRQDHPPYPPDVLQSEAGGTVELAFGIDSTGRVIGVRARKCTVSTPLGSVDFDRTLHGVDSKSHKSVEGRADYRLLRYTANKLALSAVNGVAQWTFQPGKKDGKAVNSVMAVIVNFDPPKHAGTVSIRVDGLDPTTMTQHLTTITNDEFAGMVGDAIGRTGTFAGIAPPEQATYHLEALVRILGSTQTFSATLDTRWILTRASDQKVLWDSDLTSTADSNLGQTQAALALSSAGSRGRANAQQMGTAIAASDSTKLAAYNNAHDALKELWSLKF